MTLHFDNTAGDQLPLMTLDAHPMDRHYETMYEVHDPALKLMARQLFGEGASCTNAFRALCLPLVAPTLAWHARDTDIGVTKAEGHGELPVMLRLKASFADGNCGCGFIGEACFPAAMR